MVSKLLDVQLGFVDYWSSFEGKVGLLGQDGVQYLNLRWSTIATDTIRPL